MDFQKRGIVVRIYNIEVYSLLIFAEYTTLKECFLQIIVVVLCDNELPMLVQAVSARQC